MHEKGHGFRTVSLFRAPNRAAVPRKRGESMAEPGALDYFYGTEAERYTFYRIPKVLFTDPGFKQTEPFPKKRQ